MFTQQRRQVGLEGRDRADHSLSQQVPEELGLQTALRDLSDLLCVGATDNIMLSSTIGRNKNLIPGEVISAIINGTEEFNNHALVIANEQLFNRLNPMQQNKLMPIAPDPVTGQQAFHDTVVSIKKITPHIFGEVQKAHRILP